MDAAVVLQQPEALQTQLQADVLDLVPADVGSVLDVGCGDGRITHALPLRLKVVGVDHRPEALGRLRREGRRGSLTAIPFEDGAFDLVLTTDGLQHLTADQLTAAIKELTRVARKYVLIGVPQREQLRAGFARCGACGHTYHVQGHQRRWAEGDLVHDLLPEPWKAVEVRHTGLFRPLDDPTIELRHKLDAWEPRPGAVCPACAAPDAAAPHHERIGRSLDCLAASQWWTGPPPRFAFDDRGDLLVLFSRKPRRPRLYRPSAPTIAHEPLLALDFTNPLQRVSAWAAGPRWPCYLGSPEHVRCAAGVRLVGHGFSPTELALRFPVQPAPGDTVVLTLSTEGRDTQVTLSILDALRDKTIMIETRRVRPGSQELRFVLGDEVRDAYADRLGLLVVLEVEGGAVVRRAEYVPGGDRPRPTVPWLYVAPGHQVFSQRTPDYIRSWGFTSLEGGKLPLPEELTDPPAEPAPARESIWGKQRADHLLFGIEQELAGPGTGLQVLENYHKVIAHRGRRVLVLSHLFPSRAMPGVGPFVHEQVSALRLNSGLDARVVCCVPFWLNTCNPLKVARAYRAYRRLFANLHWENRDGVPVLYLPYLVGGFFQPWLHAITYGNAVMAASDWLRRRFDFEVIHAHTSYLDGTAALRLSRKFDLPYLLTEHTGPFRLLTDHPLKRRFTVRALTHARRVFCVSGALAGDVRGVLPPEQHAKVGVLHNGVDTALFYPPRQWSPDPAAPRFLSVISLDENKNPLLLLGAFKRLHAERPGARLAIAGAGPLHDALVGAIREAGLESAVTLLGFRTRTEVARLMREECDAFVLPSNSETFGVVLIEALASGKPVVATDCGGPRDIVTGPAVGALCRPRDEQSLYAGLRQVAAGLAHYRAEAIRRHALEQFDYFNLAARLADEYDRAAGD